MVFPQLAHGIMESLRIHFGFRFCGSSWENNSQDAGQQQHCNHDEPSKILTIEIHLFSPGLKLRRFGHLPRIDDVPFQAVLAYELHKDKFSYQIKSAPKSLEARFGR